MVFWTRNADRSNDPLQALPHSNNSIVLSHNRIGQVVEVPGAIDGFLQHNTRHKYTIRLSSAGTTFFFLEIIIH
jgi:hypothetical protein